jgi:hypothetical protein
MVFLRLVVIHIKSSLSLQSALHNEGRVDYMSEEMGEGAQTGGGSGEEPTPAGGTPSEEPTPTESPDTPTEETPGDNADEAS